VVDAPGRVAARIDSADVAPHRCFVCGTLNEHGMHLVMHVEADRSWVELELEPRFQGWEGIAHGGIVATILDEVMAWSLAGADNWGVTARMSITYRKPVPLGVPIRADGWIATQRRRVIDTQARLIDARDGTELATATGVYVAADEARKRQLRERYRLLPEATG
jgi:acyl-coenzyme A thioesterase PaaI-like protein